MIENIQIISIFVFATSFMYAMIYPFPKGYGIFVWGGSFIGSILVLMITTAIRIFIP